MGFVLHLSVQWADGDHTGSKNSADRQLLPLLLISVGYSILRTLNRKQFWHIQKLNTDSNRFCTQITSQPAAILNTVFNSTVTCSVIQFPNGFSSVFKYIMHWQYRNQKEDRVRDKFNYLSQPF